MTAKEYLSKIQVYRRAVEGAEQRLEELYEQASGLKAIVYDKDRVQVSPENRFEEMMVKVDAQATKVARTILRYQQEVEKRERQIAGMDKPEHVEILRLRYIEVGKDGRPLTLEKIACIMNRSYHSVKHLHGWALDAFQKKYLKS